MQLWFSLEFLDLLSPANVAFLQVGSTPDGKGHFPLSRVLTISESCVSVNQLKRSLHQSHTINRVPTVHAIAGGRARRRPKDADPFIMADRIGALAFQLSEFSRTKGLGSVGHSHPV